MSRSEVVLLDLDNCVAEDAWRKQYIRGEGEDLGLSGDDLFFDYHTLSAFDKAEAGWVIPELERLGNPSIFISTGRPERWRLLTSYWIARNLPFTADISAIFMRDNGDNGGNHEVKRNLARFILARGQRIVAAYDDNVKSIAEYRKLGIPAHRVDLAERVFELPSRKEGA